MQEPTIGRKVWFWPTSADAEMNVFASEPMQPCDATVIFVWSPNMVNLKVFDHAGVAHVRTSVLLYDFDDENRPTYSHASWMPYQQKQALKHAAEEASNKP